MGESAAALSGAHPFTTIKRIGSGPRMLAFIPASNRLRLKSPSLGQKIVAQSTQRPSTTAAILIPGRMEAD
ncbi:hypothetical protein V1287_003142 [Bradyrhizobium sp. AZCC 1699]